MSDPKPVIRGAEISREMARNLDIYQSFGKYLTDACNEHPDAIFMVDAETKKYITCKEALDTSYKIAKLLMSRGGSPDSVIAIVSENSFEYPSLLLAVLHIGAVCTCMNPRYSTNEFRHTLNISRTSIVLTTSKFSERIKNVVEECDRVKEVINVDEIVDAEYDDQFQSEVDETKLTNSSTAIVLYSSGTTAMSKGVEQTHKAWIVVMELMRTEKLIPLPRNNVVSGFLLMCHTYGLYTLLTCLVLGHKYVLMKRYYDESTFARYIEEFRMNTVYIGPTVAAFLAKDTTVDNHDVSSVKLVGSGGGILRAEIQETIRRRFDCDFLNAFGMTETAGMTLYAVSSSKPGVTGRLVPGMMAKIVDKESGKILGAYHKGELVLKGPQLSNGYLGAESGAFLRDSDGWFHTGDLAYYDDDDDFFILDRLKEVMRYRDFQVSPAELENVIMQHPEVVAVGVVGVPDVEAGELPRAYVVKKSGSGLTEDDILQYVANNVSPQKKLRGGVRFVDDLPKTSTGKMNRKELKLWVVNSS